MGSQVALKMSLALLVISFVETYSALPNISFLKHPILDIQKWKRSIKENDINQKGCNKDEVDKFGTDFSKCVEKTTVEHLQKILTQVPNVNAMKATTCQMLTKSVGCVAKTSPKCASKAEREETEQAVLEQLVEMVKKQPGFGEEFISGCPILEKKVVKVKNTCTEDDLDKFTDDYPECVEKVILEEMDKILEQESDVDAMKATACQMLTKSVECVAESTPKCNMKGMEGLIKELEKSVIETLVEMVESDEDFGEGFISSCPILKKYEK